MKSLIISNLASKNANTKYTTASSFKYFCVKNIKIDNDIKDLIYALLTNMNENEIRTKTSILKSLNTIAYNIPSAIIQYISKEEFFNPLKNALRFFQVREIDFGPFK